MAWSANHTWSSLEVVTATLLNTYLRDNLNAVGVTTTYSPTIGGTGWAKGNGTLTGYYVTYGNRVDVTVRFELGTTSTGGSGALTLSAPAGPVATGQGVGKVLMGKGGFSYQGTAQLASSQINPYCQTSAAGLLSGITNALPSAGNWASGDSIYVSISYYI